MCCILVGMNHMHDFARANKNICFGVNQDLSHSLMTN